MRTTTLLLLLELFGTLFPSLWTAPSKRKPRASRFPVRTAAGLEWVFA